MKTSHLILPALLAACLPASAIRIADAHYDGVAFQYIGGGFDNTIQTDPMGAENGTSVKADATPTFDGPDTRYDIDFRASIGLSYDLTATRDITLGVPVELLIQIFDPGFQKLSRVEITGANLTKFELDESGATEGYPSLRLKMEPTDLALSASYQLPVTSRLGLSLHFDSTFDGLDTDYQTVIVTNTSREDLGDAMHPSSGWGVGVTSNFAGSEGEPARFRYFLRSGLIDSYGASYTFDDVQGSVNGYTYPSGFQFNHLGDPASLGVSYDLGYAAQGYYAYDLEYDGWDGADDIQIGVNFAPRDNDSDGLPNHWEDTNGFNKDVRNPADSDPDLDWQTTWEEFLQGTNPNAWDSRLYVMMVDFNKMTGGLGLSWSSRDDRNYELHYRNPVSSKWEGVPGTGIISGDAGSTNHTIDDVRSKIGDNAQIRVALSVGF